MMKAILRPYIDRAIRWFNSLRTNVAAYVRGFFLLRIWEIDHNLYQSGHFVWWTRYSIWGRGIKMIVDLEGARDVDVPGVDRVIYWPIVDGPLPDLLRLNEVAEEVYQRAKLDRVLVHCGAGANRSGLVNSVVLYKRGYRGQGILDKIRTARPKAMNNPIFEKYVLDTLA